MVREPFILVCLVACFLASQTVAFGPNSLKDDVNLLRTSRFDMMESALKNIIHNFKLPRMSRRANPEDNMNVTELITSKGYPCEDHVVQTEDGFLLSVQRIPYGRTGSSPKRPVAFLQHGLLCSAADWVVNLANESLGFVLADAGFDVWIGNSRGNTYSHKHVRYTPDQEEFWAWSWDQMAQYDVPAMINHALSVAGQENLYYIGHSQGTMQMFAHLSQDLAFNDKIKIFFALGPVTTVNYIKSPLRYLAALPDKETYRILGRKELLSSSEIFHILADTICVEPATRLLCYDVLFLICGPDVTNINMSRLDVYINHTPAGVSVQDIVHFAQGVRHGNFQMYDFGSAADNMAHYNQSTPPLYDVTKITAPVVLFYAKNDWLADERDVNGLIPKLKNLKYSKEIKDWNHLDFIWGEDAFNVLYKTLIHMMMN